MAKIKQLDPVTVNHIAAGEVVERPASVVKELVDNALDAGASQIFVSIRNGGISEISVQDNGAGMNDTDARNSLLSHYTSKITKLEDLEQIDSMGFRGEALPSIASVAKLLLKTREPGAEYGYEIRAEAGKIVSQGQCSCSEGTVVTVKELFHNTPARFKFLKKDSLEAGYIADMLARLALTRPDVSFRLSDEKERTVLYTPGNNDLLSTIYAVFGKNTAEGMIKLDSLQKPIQVFGYISTPENARGNRSRQIFIVNGRVISSKTLTAAVDEACRGWFVKSRFPALVLHLTVPKELIDINVHPQKSELRFWNDKEAFRAVYHAVQEGLAAESQLPEPLLAESKDLASQEEALSFSLPPESTESDLRDFPAQVARDVRKEDEEVIEANLSVSEGVPALQPSDLYGKRGKGIAKTEQISLSELGPGKKTNGQATAGKTEKLKGSIFSNARIIGVFAKIYILLEASDQLILVDQHAAHERILYEELLAKRDKVKGAIPSQLLAQPQKMEISALEMAAVEENKEKIEELGFLYDIFGRNIIVLRAVPEIRSDLNPELAFSALIEACLNDSLEKDHKYDDLLHDIACKAAVKANDSLAEIEIRKLLEDLEALTNPYHCPHGRPVAIIITRKDLDKMFKRIVG